MSDPGADVVGAPARIGVSACFMHPDDERLIFKGKTLLYVEQSMAWWVQSGGALSYLVPTVRPAADGRVGSRVGVDAYVTDLDGLLLHGGADVCPLSYGEEPLRPEWEGDAVRDAYELELVRAFIAAGKPVLGICRGHQILNVAFGGTLWQDQREQGATDRVHRSQERYDRNIHRVEIEPGSRLASLYPGRSGAVVNSVHHQAVKDVGSGLVVEARADDGLVEALRAEGTPGYVASVQWHPEFMFMLDGEGDDWLDNGPILDEFLAAASVAPRRSRRMLITNPATGDVIAELADDTSDSVGAATAAARQAQPAWAAAPVAEHVEVVRAFRAGLVRRRDDLAAVLTSETGKPITQAGNEIDGVLARIDFFLDQVEPVIADEVVVDQPADGLREVVGHEPLGVIANISAWNYPYFVGLNVIVPALLTGNGVLYKPSEHATLTGDAIVDLLRSAGVPRPLISALHGEGPVGQALLDQPVDGVFFTGSYPTGRRIAEQVAGRMIPVQLELGGKDPVYVAPDVDVATAAASLADGAFYNAGQSCCSVERIYVHESIHDEFVAAFVMEADRMRIGDPTLATTDLGPLTRPAQLDVLDAQVADAVEQGASLRAGGRRVDERWFAPTVLTGVHHGMAVMTDESFGPIIGIQRVDDDDEAVRLMNDTEFGLTAGVYSADEGRARAVLDQVAAGSAYWNCCDRVSPRLPWSGRGHSGIGTTLSTAGIAAFTKPKAWHLRST